MIKKLIPLLITLLITPQVALGQMTAPAGGTGLSTYAAGDMIYAATLNPIRFTKLNIGGAGTCLVSNGSIPTWSSCSGGGAGSGTVSTSTDLVAGQVDFSTGPSTIGNDSTFLFSTTLKRLTFSYGSTTALTVSETAYIPKLGNLNTAGFVKTSSDGTLSVDTNTYSTFAWPFDAFANYVSTSTTLGFLNGLFSTASSTFSSNLFLTSLSQGLLYTGSNSLVNAVSTSTLTATSPLTGSFTQIGSGGSLGCQTASGSQAGCLSSADWTTFNNKESALTFSWPLIRTINAISFGGLATSSPWTTDGVAYRTSNNTIATAATTTASCSGSTSCSPFTVIGASPITISSTGGSSFAWPFTANTGYVSTSTTLGLLNGFFSTASSTISGAFRLPAISDGCLTVTTGLVSSQTCGSGTGNPGTISTSTTPTIGNLAYWTTSGAYPELLGKVATTSATCSGSASCSAFTVIGASPITITGSGLTSYDAFTHPNYVGASATTSLIGIGTTTPKWSLTVASSTGPQIALTGTGANIWTMREAGGYLYFATVTPTTFATSSASALTISPNGYLGVSTSSPLKALSVVGDEWHTSNFVHMGNSVGTINCDVYGGKCAEFVYNDNTVGGGYIEVQNVNSGTSAYTGISLLNNLGGSNVSNYAGLFLNSSTYTDGSFGTANVGANLLALQNYMGGISIQASSTSMGSWGSIPFYINGAVAGAPGTGNEVARVNINGLSVGTTTSYWPVSIASTTRAQLSLQGATTDSSFNFRSIGGSLYIATGSPITFATATNAITITSATPGTAGLLIGTSTLGSTGLSVVGTVFMHSLTTAAGTPSSICMNATTKEITVNAALTCTVSSALFKNLHGELTLGMDTLLQIEPEIFSYKDQPGRTRYGFIAEQVAAVDQNFGDAFEGINPRSIDQNAILALVVSSVKDFYSKFQTAITDLINWNKDQDASLQQLEQENAALKARIEALEARIQ